MESFQEVHVGTSPGEHCVEKGLLVLAQGNLGCCLRKWEMQDLSLCVFVGAGEGLEAHLRLRRSIKGLTTGFVLLRKSHTCSVVP